MGSIYTVVPISFFTRHLLLYYFITYFSVNRILTFHCLIFTFLTFLLSLTYPKF